MNSQPQASIIQPSHFRLPLLEEDVFLFYSLQHFHLFHELVKGSTVKSYGPAKRFRFERNGRASAALGGFIGAPIAAIILENAIVSGGRFFRAFGTCGWVGANPIDPGCALVPVEGYDETGMMKDYGSQSGITNFKSASENASGKIVSVNSFYRLTPDNVKRYRSLGIDMIDMEAAPLNHICLIRDVLFNPLFVVSDSVDPAGQWHNWSAQPEFKKAIDIGLQTLLALP